MKWQGVFPAITTKFTSDGGVDLAVVEAVVAHALKHRPELARLAA